jgi:hypothetical protein
MAVFWDMAPCTPVEIGQRWPPSSVWLPLKCRSVSTRVQGATSHKTAIFILAVVRTWNVNHSLKVFLEEYREMTATFVQQGDLCFPNSRRKFYNVNYSVCVLSIRIARVRWPFVPNFRGQYPKWLISWADFVPDFFNNPYWNVYWIWNLYWLSKIL